jgi:hypothetical protein
VTVSLERRFRLYRFYDEHGALLYIGMTGRAPFRRLLEHICDKPWAREMARWEVDPRSFDTEAEVLAAERAAIRAEHPRYNVVHNDRRRVHPDPATRRGRAGNRSRRQRRVFRVRRVLRVRPPRTKAGKRFAGWATLSLFVFGLSMYYTDVGAAPSGVGAALFGCVVLIPTRRRRRR